MSKSNSNKQLDRFTVKKNDFFKYINFMQSNRFDCPNELYTSYIKLYTDCLDLYCTENKIIDKELYSLQQELKKYHFGESKHLQSLQNDIERIKDGGLPFYYIEHYLEESADNYEGLDLSNYFEEEINLYDVHYPLVEWMNTLSRQIIVSKDIISAIERIQSVLVHIYRNRGRKIDGRASFFTKIEMSVEELLELHEALSTEGLIDKDRTDECDFIYYFNNGSGDKPEKTILWKGTDIELALFIRSIVKEGTNPEWCKVDNIFDGMNGSSLRSQLCRLKKKEKQYKEKLEEITNRIGL